MALHVALCLLCIFITINGEKVYYDSYSSSILNQTQVAALQNGGNSFYCLNSFDTCSITEGRRIDGSCNNLNEPSAGAGHSQYSLFMPVVFDAVTGFLIRTAVNVSIDLPNERFLRTKIFKENSVNGHNLTQLFTLFLEFTIGDLSGMSVEDVDKYVITHPNCCNEAGKDDEECYVINVPDDDEVLSKQNITCLNMTYTINYQEKNCVNPLSPVADSINYGTPFFDLSILYGNDLDTSTSQRLFSGGLLNFTMESGAEYPLYKTRTTNIYDGIQGFRGIVHYFGLWFFREHNRIARKLGQINPSWNDERIFYTARDINIGIFGQITFYEMLSALLGQNSLLNDGVLSKSNSYRDIYDDKIVPTLYLEPLVALRWTHTIQNAVLQRYNSSGTYLGDFPGVYLTSSNYKESISTFTQGFFRTQAAKNDRYVDPYLAEKSLGDLQQASDIFTSDLARSRRLGMGPYIHFLKFCDGENHDTFEDLKDYIYSSDRKLLEELYDNIQDVDMIVGLWLERIKKGSYVPKTLYCLLSKQLLNMIKSDRHWYERKYRPNAFSNDQLAEIRKASVARILCDNADSVSESGIQKYPFFKISNTNPIVSCDSIPSVDLNAWKDTTNILNRWYKLYRAFKG